MIGWVEENILIMQQMFIYCLRITFVVCALILPFPCAQICYILQHHRFQIYFLLHHLNHINSNYEDFNDDYLYCNKNYQITIRQRLVFCIKRHTDLLSLGQRMTPNSGIFIFLFAITGGFVMISILLFVTSVQDMPLIVYIRLYYVTFSSVFILYAYYKEGQAIENAYEEIIAALRNTNWYCWNNANQKYYFNIYTMASKASKIKITENVSFNYQLGASVVKGIYSGFCLLYHMNMSNI
ncbi:uncharacterized protein LOC107398952 [Tribolium castaneum]|uniref:uncharacterized protein LOC107398952 n=1 Tax=Tribolium castaneum TaxID=7070 RepID=UPI00077DEE46|nr:PREDICTED: uncharacterized protein LOC107398952 [Tribolium castaneum]|eukprot:XP_015840018.1 PREDICTED: uncharacterized protein LOC107398952 [Tribolium castaneum]